MSAGACWRLLLQRHTGNSTVTGYRTGRYGRLALTNDIGVATPPSTNSQGASTWW
ncbi:hypothetical protein [Streptomyces vastus]|uniref:hypothetical protein n=1 Tax=Streptomyces vastus TaxID=285451 RepID=UPI0031DA47DE